MKMRANGVTDKTDKTEVAGFPATVRAWLLMCMGGEVPRPKLRARAKRECAPLPVGQARVVLSVLEYGRRNGPETGMTCGDIEKMSGGAVGSECMGHLERKGWLFRLGHNRGDGWILCGERVPAALEMEKRILMWMAAAKAKLTNTETPKHRNTETRERGAA